jgi:hypothetical protein
MGRTGCVVALLGALFLVGCGDDGGGSGGGSDAGNASADAPGSGGGTLLISGTDCDGPFSFHLAGDERLVFYRATGQSLVEGFAILDGSLFDIEDEAMWQTYAQSHDVLLVLGFVTEIPLAPAVVTNTFDSFFAARDVGVVGFDDSLGSPRVEIVSIDTSAMTTSVTFDMPVGGSTSAYPPAFDMFTECETAGHTATGSYTGAYEVYDF